MAKEERKMSIKPVYIGVCVGLVVLVAAGLIYVIFLMGEAPPPSSCTGFSQAKPVDWKVTSKGQLSLTLMNDAGTKIHVNNVRVSVYNDPCANLSLERDMRAGDTFIVNVTGCKIPSTGEYYKADVTITYKDTASGIYRNSVGECHGSVEN